jgi:3-dehydroquinate synthase
VITLTRFEVVARDRTYPVTLTDDFRTHLADYGDAFVLASRSAWERHCQGVPAGRLLLLDASESLKSLLGVADLAGRLMDAGVRKDHTLVAIGGGTILDAVAFTASILYRGMHWVYFPTSLVAQADACIGGKTAINVGERKNAVGNFHPPSAVYVDPSFLSTLPERDLRSGIGEILHFYLHGGSPLLEELASNHATLVADPSGLARHVEEALRIKAAVVQRDEFDAGERNLLNYGHTFGHALESVTGYAISHGEAVTYGMEIANRLSVRTGILVADECDRISALLAPNMPTLPPIDLTAYLKALGRDRKNDVPGMLTCILCRGVGRLSIERVPLDDSLRAFLGTVLP